jgi:hypothetical protein
MQAPIVARIEASALVEPAPDDGSSVLGIAVFSFCFAAGGRGLRAVQAHRPLGPFLPRERHASRGLRLLTIPAASRSRYRTATSRRRHRCRRDGRHVRLGARVAWTLKIAALTEASVCLRDLVG